MSWTPTTSTHNSPCWSTSTPARRARPRPPRSASWHSATTRLSGTRSKRPRNCSGPACARRRWRGRAPRGRSGLRAADPALVADPVPLSENALEHLARRGAWQGLDEVDRPRPLEAAEARAAEVEQLRLRAAHPGTQRHDGLHRLPPSLVGHADDCGVGDRRMLEQDALDHPRIDVLPARDDYVLAPVLDEQIAVVVDAANVAGAQRSVAQRLGRLIRSPPVAAHQLRATRADLATVTGRDLVVGFVDHLKRRARRRTPGGQEQLGSFIEGHPVVG